MSIGMQKGKNKIKTILRLTGCSRALYNPRHTEEGKEDPSMKQTAMMMQMMMCEGSPRFFGCVPLS